MKKKIFAALLPVLYLLMPHQAVAAAKCKDFPTHQAAQKYYLAKKPGCDCNPGGNGKKCPKKHKK